jgi:hypothetical protein
MNSSGSNFLKLNDKGIMKEYSEVKMGTNQTLLVDIMEQFEP